MSGVRGTVRRAPGRGRPPGTGAAGSGAGRVTSAGGSQRAATTPGTRAVSMVGESVVRFHGILASTAAMAQV